MIAVTGGAGFIGSAIIWSLNQRGINNIVIPEETSRLSSEKKKNLECLRFSGLLDSEEFLKKYSRGLIKADCIFHMGACSRTTETDRNYVMKTNYEYTRRLAEAAADKGARFIYASSAATYGDGSKGFSDAHSSLTELEPMNLYGESKHLFDLYALESGLIKKTAGLKFFNVYGPNEYHKEDMRSFVIKAYGQVVSEEKLRLFKSYRDEFPDGGQRRDFIYVKDAAAIALYFYDNPGLCGIYNSGTGRARTWNSLALSVFNAMNAEPRIEYIDMPSELKDQYQYYTCGEMEKLKNSGFRKPFSTVEEGIFDYIRSYLTGSLRLGC